jgi:hypothetical protein
MKTALIISGIVLLWYCINEARKSEPNWPRAINSALFWPLSLFFNINAKENLKK